MAGAVMREHPVLLYDGDCAFCSSSVRVLRARVDPPVDFFPWQQVRLADYRVTEDQVRREVRWIGTDGSAAGGAPAVSAVLRSRGGGWRLVGGLMRVPVVRQLAAVAYRIIAINRHRLPGGTAACAVRLPPPPPEAPSGG
jgi:predicted DCC family thiol-disulfide oxidoreductase YuxK